MEDLDQRLAAEIEMYRHLVAEVGEDTIMQFHEHVRTNLHLLNPLLTASKVFANAGEMTRELAQAYTAKNAYMWLDIPSLGLWMMRNKQHQLSLLETTIWMSCLLSCPQQTDVQLPDIKQDANICNPTAPETPSQTIVFDVDHGWLVAESNEDGGERSNTEQTTNTMGGVRHTLPFDWVADLERKMVSFSVIMLCIAKAITRIQFNQHDGAVNYEVGYKRVLYGSSALRKSLSSFYNEQAQGQI